MSGSSDTKISALPAVAALDGAEISPTVQAGVTKHATKMDDVRLASAKRAGLVFDTAVQAMALVPSLSLPIGSVITCNGSAAAGDGGAGAIYKSVSVAPSHNAKRFDGAGTCWVLASPEPTPDMCDAVGDGVADDTAAFDAVSAVSSVIKLTAGKNYRLNAWKPGSKCLVVGTKGASISKAAGAACAIDLSTGSATLQNVMLDNEVYDADGNVDPARAGTSIMTAFGVNTITVSAGHGSRFAVGMTAFWDSTYAAGVADTSRIENVDGDVLTFTRDHAHDPVIGSKIIADFPMIEVGDDSSACLIENVIIWNCIVGVRTGGWPIAAGNISLSVRGLRVMACCGAAVVQMEGAATEMMTELYIGGVHSTIESSVASAGQTVFEYDYVVTPYPHDAYSITATVNGAAAEVVSVDMDARTATLGTPCAGGETVVVKNNQKGARGVLCDGINGTVSGLGRLSNSIIIGTAVGLHVRGGTDGVQFLETVGVTIDGSSFAGVLCQDANRVELSACDLWASPYPLRVEGAGSVTVTAGPLWTTVSKTPSLYDPALRPDRAHIYVADDVGSVFIDRWSWTSESDTIYDPGKRITWAPRSTWLQDGTADVPAQSFYSSPTTGYRFDPVGKIWRLQLEGTEYFRLDATGARIRYGTSTNPAFGFIDTTSGLYRRTASATKPDRWLVDGTERWFWGTTSVGPISAPFIAGSYTVSQLASLSNFSAAEDGAIVFCSNGNAGSPCFAVRSGGAWLRVPLGAAISSVS